MRRLIYAIYAVYLCAYPFSKFQKKFKNFFFTTITQKAHKTYSALEGADVGVLWSYMVEETGVP